MCGNAKQCCGKCQKGAQAQVSTAVVARGAAVRLRAEEIWGDLNVEQRKTVALFGEFPAPAMMQAEEDGINAHELSVAIMHIADHSDVVSL